MLTPGTPPPFPLRWGFSTRLDAPETLPPRRLDQVHRCGVVEAGEDVVAADGLWTTTPGFPIGVRVADCVPILLAGLLASGTPWVAALHAGWRGATGHGDAEPGGGILRRGVARFQALGGHPGDLAWALGPAILACHFEVGPEVIDAARLDPAWREDLQAPGPSGKPPPGSARLPARPGPAPGPGPRPGRQRAPLHRLPPRPALLLPQR